MLLFAEREESEWDGWYGAGDRWGYLAKEIIFRRINVSMSYPCHTSATHLRRQVDTPLPFCFNDETMLYEHAFDNKLFGRCLVRKKV